MTLSTISILKKSEQKIYSLLRMEDPAELREQYVFSRKTEEDESTVMTTHSVLSIATATGSATGSDMSSPLQEMPEDYASALSAAGLTGGTPRRTPLPVDDEDGGWMEEIPRHKDPEVIRAEYLTQAYDNGIGKFWTARSRLYRSKQASKHVRSFYKTKRHPGIRVQLKYA